MGKASPRPAGRPLVPSFVCYSTKDFARSLARNELYRAGESLEFSSPGVLELNLAPPALVATGGVARSDQRAGHQARLLGSRSAAGGSRAGHTALGRPHLQVDDLLQVRLGRGDGDKR